MSNLNWNQIRADFHDANQSMSNSIGALSQAGTVFGQLRKSILDEEQRAVDNAYREKKFNEDVRQFGLKYALDQDKLREEITANRNREDLMWRGQNIQEENAKLHAQVSREAIAQREKEYNHKLEQEAKEAKLQNEWLYKFSGQEAKDKKDAWFKARDPIEFQAGTATNNLQAIKNRMAEIEGLIGEAEQSGNQVGGKVSPIAYGTPEYNALVAELQEYKRQLPAAQKYADDSNRALKDFDTTHPEPPTPQEQPKWLQPMLSSAMALTSQGIPLKTDIASSIFTTGLQTAAAKSLNEQKHDLKVDEDEKKPPKPTVRVNQPSLDSAITHEKKLPLQDDNIEPITSIALKAKKWANDQGISLSNNELADILDKVLDVKPNWKIWGRSTLGKLTGEDRTTKRSSRYDAKVLKQIASRDIADNNDTLMKELRRQILELAMTKGYKSSK